MAPYLFGSVHSLYASFPWARQSSVRYIAPSILAFAPRDVITIPPSTAGPKDREHGCFVARGGLFRRVLR